MATINVQKDTLKSDQSTDSGEKVQQTNSRKLIYYKGVNKH